MALEILQVLGFEALSSLSAVDGIELYREHRDSIAAVLMDLTTPEMSGTEIFKAIRNLNPSAPIVVCTGYPVKGESAALLEIGAAAFLQKPFSISEMKHVLSKVIEQTPD